MDDAADEGQPGRLVMPDRTERDMRKLVAKMIKAINIESDEDFSQNDTMYYFMVKCYVYEENMDN